MSIINCDECDRHVDTDYNSGGIWPSVDSNDMSKPDYICESCVEDLSLHDLAELGYDQNLEFIKENL